MSRSLLPLTFAALLGLGWAAGQRASAPRFYKGNAHTHTLWSDGDGAPDVACAWYANNGYDFLVLTDHNVLAQGERWFPVSEDGSARLRAGELDQMRAAFGDEHVRVREHDGRRELRLATFDELRARFARPGELLLLQGEEVTASWREEPTGEEGAQPRSLPVHVNAWNLAEVVAPPGGASPRDVMNACVARIHEQATRLELPTIAHVNHPNFGWALTWEDLAHLEGDRFFEVYNGHRGVRNHGDAQHLSTEAMWDRALVARLTELDLGLLYGVATDDTHDYFGDPTSQPGRGWVRVRAKELTAEALVEAVRAGDFYASSGVELEDFGHDARTYRVDLEREPGATYTTRFVGTRMRDGAPGEAGEVLLETGSDPAVYRFDGDELYVRAIVVSSRDHPNPFVTGDKETAWLQPVVPASHGE